MADGPRIDDYALLGDGFSAALVGRDGSVDWCCLPRLDAGSCFARLLDAERGGSFALAPAEVDATIARDYLAGTLVLETIVQTRGAQARVLDCMTVNADDPASPYCQLLRVVEGVRGGLDFRARIAPRFDYGSVAPWLRHERSGVHTAIGGETGLVISGDAELAIAGRHDLEASFEVRPGRRVRLSLAYLSPHAIDAEPPPPLGSDELDRRLDATIGWWREWSAQISVDGADEPLVRRSAIVLKALANPATGAIAAAATTSLPESPGGSLNWDYRYSWLRDSAFSVRSLANVGCREEADAFRRFVQRSAAGSAGQLQIMYGVDGRRRLTEVELDHLSGYRGARPVRVGNLAAEQHQHDVYGEIAELTWRWQQRGRSPDDDYWRFFVDLVDAAGERWEEPDFGLWEIRGEPRHFVHSKVMCWTALDHGIRLAEQSMRQAPLERWRKQRDEIRAAVEREGYDDGRGVYVQTFGDDALDAALLLLPDAGFVEYGDERMVRTVAAIREELEVDGLLLRYRAERGMGEPEGTFLACTFWLAECLARQRRPAEARTVFDRAMATANELGLFSEEYDCERREMLGNFPQALTHLSHIAAAVALADVEGAGG